MVYLESIVSMENIMIHYNKVKEEQSRSSMS